MNTLDGVLFFPVTPFSNDGAEIVTDRLAEHIDRGVSAGAGGVFAACGTGEFHALDTAEFDTVTKVAVETVAQRVGVYVGAGGPLPVAIDQARRAERLGADGLLLLPPYLVEAPPAGLLEYVRAVAASTALPVIVYNRANALFDAATAVELTRIPNVVGLKDGASDFDQLSRIVHAVRGEIAGKGQRFEFFNGAPTAEVTVPAYRGMGVNLYSSAVFAFAPEISLAFYRAVTGGDDAAVDRLLRTFFHPLVALRDQVPGYAVSLVKAAVTLRGIESGPVRPPLVMPTADHLAELEGLIEAGLRVVDAEVRA